MKMRYDMYQGYYGEGQYFHLNTFSMHYIFKMMNDLNMLDLDIYIPPLPDPKEHGVEINDNYYRIYQEYDDNGMISEQTLSELGDEYVASILLYIKRTEDTLAFASSFPKGIPPYKLYTNDGWWVTPKEIQAALRKIDMENLREPLFKATTDQGEEVFRNWILWLEDVANNGGFRVY